MGFIQSDDAAVFFGMKKKKKKGMIDPFASNVSRP